jgi:hypothetical protein
VSSVFANPSEPREMEWARLIPGEIPEPKKLGKKRPASVKQFALAKDRDRTLCAPRATERRERTLEALLPRPLQSRAAEKWVLSMVLDFTDVDTTEIFNWFRFISMTVWRTDGGMDTVKTHPFCVGG